MPIYQKRPVEQSDYYIRYQYSLFTNNSFMDQLVLSFFILVGDLNGSEV
jgi:hypothetical protein